MKNDRRLMESGTAPSGTVKFDILGAEGEKLGKVSGKPLLRGDGTNSGIYRWLHDGGTSYGGGTLERFVTAIDAAEAYLRVTFKEEPEYVGDPDFYQHTISQYQSGK